MARVVFLLDSADLAPRTLQAPWPPLDNRTETVEQTAASVSPFSPEGGLSSPPATSPGLPHSRERHPWLSSRTEPSAQHIKWQWVQSPFEATLPDAQPRALGSRCPGLGVLFWGKH